MATVKEIEEYIFETQAFIYAFKMQHSEVSDAVAELMQKQHDNYRALWRAFNRLSDEYNKLNALYRNYMLTNPPSLY